MDNFQAADYIMNTYQRKIWLDHGSGSWVFDLNGKKYLDFTSGIATCALGHANPEITKVIAYQAAKMIGCSNLFYTEPQALLAKKLAEITGLGKCFFSNSGTEAIEAAIKLARKTTKKTKIISMENGFHGRTLGSLSATWNTDYKSKFEPLVPGFEYAKFGDIDSLKNKVDANTAAVILEPIQGESGIILPGKGYLEKVKDLCNKKGLLLIVDEIQTGNGRTGKYFCYMYENIQPDIVTTAKGLANGFPIGVTIAKKKLDFEPGDHGSTFGGNSLCCSVALKTISIIEMIMPEIEKKGIYLTRKLNAINSQYIKKVRGKGLIIGIELNIPAERIVFRCIEKGLLINKVHTNVLRLLPALTISYEEMDIACRILKSVLEGEEHD